MSRHRFCPTSDRDGVIEELAQEIWEERTASADEPWLTSPRKSNRSSETWRQTLCDFLNMAMDEGLVGNRIACPHPVLRR